MNFDFVCPHCKESAKVDLNVELDFGKIEIYVIDPLSPSKQFEQKSAPELPEIEASQSLHTVEGQ